MAARPVLLVLLLGFLSMHGWMISCRGDGGEKTNINRRLSAHRDAASAARKVCTLHALEHASRPYRAAPSTQPRTPELE